jgi:mannose/cellobiose epimerase-like protein (N-acyl-D-glucosamine 2-epimerase family)
MPDTDTIRIADQAARFKRWMFDDALPLWATAGRDLPGLGFHESLNLDGSPADVGFKRMRVQARQIYSFSHAALLGWSDGCAVASAGYDFITAHGWCDAGGWARRLGPGGGIIDPSADLYDNAFVLFALAWYARATGSDKALGEARRTLAWIEATMRASSGSGFEHWLPVDGSHRQQNPHMHLLEAILALHGTAPDPALLDLAGEVVGLFRRHFFNRTSGTLAEFFGADWSPAPGEAGTLVEPGHHYEWVWLLQRYQALSGDDVAAEADALYHFAERFGTNHVTGFIVNALNNDGTLRDGAARLWPQTEELKAHLAIGERRGAPLADKVERAVGNLLDHYLMVTPRGAWIDVFDEAGRAAVSLIPASSLYHIFVAFAELDRAASEASMMPLNRPAEVVRPAQS